MMNRRPSTTIIGLFAGAFIVIALLATALLVLLPSSRVAAAGAAPITLSFDHLSTGFELDGVHRDLPCESCHLNAVFKGTPRSCGICHITGSVYNATPKTQTHIQSSNDCAACHNTIAFRPDVHFDHREVMGSCVSCHNGTLAQGKGPTHPQTSDACDACHTVLSWNPPKTVDHTQIPLAVQGFCIICHNGTSATGQNKGHLVTSLECGDCHLTTTWLGANFDHTGIKTGCFSCHNGVKAVGKQGNHMPTSNLCETCHTTGIGTAAPNWVPSLFVHTQMSVQTCATCHSGTVKISTGFVSGSPTNHLPLVASAPDCGVCHGNTPTAETWTVLAASIPTLHSGLPTTNCILCHAGQTFAGVPAPYIPMTIAGISPTKKAPLVPPHIPILAGTDCSSCHGAAYAAGGFGPATAMSAAKHAFVSKTCDVCHDTGKSFYVGSGTPLQLRPANHVNSTDPSMATGDCSQCHTTTDWNSNAMPAGHMPNPSNLVCATCHVKAPNDYTTATLAANSVLHTGITGKCGLCHGDNVTALTWANNYTPKDAILTPSHIPYLAGTDCASCHKTTTYAAGTFGPMNMTQATHTFAPATCNTCHDAAGGGPYYMGAASPGLQLRPADHTSGQMVAPNDCGMCHTTANWNSTALPAGHMPNPANQACTVCHTSAPSVYTQPTLASNAILHTGIAGNCGQCHGATTALTWFNNFTPKDAVLTPGHIPYIAGTDCGSCHSSSTYAVGTFGPMNMTQAKHAFAATTCNTCHEAGLNFYMGAASPALQGRPTDHTGALAAPADCSGCHTTANWNSSNLPAGHMPNPAALNCTVCHTAAPTNYTTLAANSVMHTGITGTCGQCHGAMTALTWYNNFTPKDAILTPAHIPFTSGTDCSSCHASSTYAAGTFGPTNMTAAKHAFVPTTCITCHETGSNFYLGASVPNTLQVRPADHIASGDAQQKTGDCSICHTPASWVSSTMPIGHMPNPGNQACATCHTAITGTFASYATLTTNMAVMHTGITGGCLQCHGATQLTFYNNNDNPKPQVANHIPYLSGADCSSCHVVGTTFGPTQMSAAKHAFVPTACATCHEKGLSFFVNPAATPLQGRPADHTAGQQLTGDCSGCHNTTDWTSTVMPANHMPNPGNLACATCHTGAPANYATMASITVLHTGITGGCAQCHGATTQLTFYNNNDNPKSGVLTPAHIPYLSGTDCASCHASNYVTGGFGPMNMTAAKHAFVPTACATCHEAGLSFYMGAANPGLQGRPADHMAPIGTAQQQTGDCSGCHTTANWNSNLMPAGHMPNPGNQTCSVCHTAIGATAASYATLAPIAVLHTGISGNCGLCHGSPSGALTFYNNNDPIKAAVLTPAHIPYLTGTDCSSCHATNYAAGGFGPTNMSAAKHAFVPTTCNTCHDTGKNFYLGASTPVLQTRPPTHVSAPAPGSQQATGDCSLCHNTTVWTTPTTLPNGHMPIPGTQTCSVCHLGTLTADPNSYANMAAIPVLHTGVTTGCAQCHGGATALTFYNNNDNPKAAASLSPPHIPSFTNNDCSACHKANYVAGGFGPMNMTQATHANVSAAPCKTCHEAGMSFYMGAASPGLQGRPADHTAGQQVAPNDCSLCHTTANWSTTVLPTGHMPNPANLACNVCHTAAPTNYATLAANSVLHTGIANNCTQCHGVTQLSFYNNNDNPKSAALTPSHIPLLSGADCGSCHSSATYAAGTFGPMNMTQAKHAFVATTCNTCHEAGLSFYMGTASPALQGRPADHTSANMVKPNDCSGCHTTANWSSNSMPAGHMPNPANTACNTCHTGATATPANYALLAANSVLHTGITGNCIQCHGATQLTFYNNNDNPIPQIAKHIPYLSGTDCGSCHKTTTYAAGTFGPMNMTQATHAFVTTTCGTCHASAAGSLYMGAASPALQLRPADHTTGQMLTGDCSACHTTANWNSTTLPSGHMPNPANQACTVCHTAAPANYTTLAANSVLHTGITGNCGQCHGAATALTWYSNFTPKYTGSLTPKHIPYTSGTDCSSCHTSSTYAVGTFGPMNMTQAKHAFVPTTCNTCHEAGLSFYMGSASPALQGRPADHTSTNMAKPNDCSGCHTTANWNSNSMPAGHMPNPANTACNTCHTGATATPANYALLAANSVLHTGITGNCIQCHGATQLTFYNNNDNPKPQVAKHIPYLAATDCGSCHKTTTYAAGTFGPMNMTQATHAFVTTTCGTCHASAAGSLYMGAANPALQLRPADHSSGTMLTGDCGGCHTTANWNSTALPSGHMPNPGNQTCNVCHTSAPTNYKVFAANAVLHTGITGNCSQCHGAGTQLSFYNNDMVVKDNVLTPPHIPYLSGTDCGSCHKSTTYAAGTFGPMNMTQATHAFVATTCATCHGTATVAYYMGAANPKLQLRPSDHTTGTMLTGDCSGCHTTANWSSGTLPANHMPNPANQACATCHTAAPTNYTTLASNAILHTGIASSCITCHGAPNVAKPIFATNFSPKAASGLSPPHIPSAATPCESCHTATIFTAFSGTTMSSAKHTQLLANTGGTCDQCHDATTLSFYGVTNLQHRPSGHHVGQDCNGCHGTNNWNNAQVRKTAAAPASAKTTVSIVARTGVAGRSASGGLLSQSGVQLRGGAVGGITGGIAGSVALATGGTSVAGAPSLMGITRINHAGVVANCFSCHNGVLAAGKGPTHIASNNSCENCHTTLAWIPAHFDHRGLTATCASCHNGAAAPGKPTRHIQTNQDCSACHGTIAWTPATFNHLGVNATCQSCHNGVAATAKQIGHIPTTRDCGSCHSTLNWTTTTIAPAPLKPLISRPKPSPRLPGAINGPAR